MIQKSAVCTPSHARGLRKPPHHHKQETKFANLAQTWIRLADELESTENLLAALDEEIEPQRRTG